MNVISKNHALQNLITLVNMKKQPYYVIVRRFQFDELYQVR